MSVPTQDSPRHVVLVEPHWHGHQPTYLRQFALTLLDQGHRVTALCPFPEQPAAWMATLRPAAVGRFRAVPFARPAPVAPGHRNPEREFAVRCWTETARALAAHGVVAPDLVFLSWLDTYVDPGLSGRAIDRLFPYPWAGLYFFPGEHRGTSRHRGLALWRLRRGGPFRGRNCRGVAVLDEVALAPLGRRLAPRPVVRFPDLTDETPPAGTPLATRIREAAAGRKVIGCLGSLCKRKGVHELIRVCERSLGRPWFFVFAGKLDTVDFSDPALRDILRFLQRRPENAFVHLQVVPDGNEFNSLVAECDVLYCHYLNFPHSSNLLTKAALLRRPVLVSDRHCMAERVAAHRLGLGVAEGDVDRIADGLERLLAEPRETGRDFAGYFARHAGAGLAGPFAALLQTPPNPNP